MQLTLDICENVLGSMFNFVVCFFLIVNMQDSFTTSLLKFSFKFASQPSNQKTYLFSRSFFFLTKKISKIYEKII